jgi:hypothetical protein
LPQAFHLHHETDTMSDSPEPVAKKPRVLKPRPLQHKESSSGEEDPGASIGDPIVRDALQGEARAVAARKGGADKATDARSTSRK